MAAKDPGRNGRPWRRVRAEVLAAQPLCMMRGPKCTGKATTVDHVIPLARGGAPLDKSNLRSACAACNSRGGALISNPNRKRRRPVPRVVIDDRTPLEKQLNCSRHW